MQEDEDDLRRIVRGEIEEAKRRLREIIEQLEPFENRGELYYPNAGWIDEANRFPPAYYAAENRGLLDLREAMRAARLGLETTDIDVLRHCRSHCEQYLLSGGIKFAVHHRALRARSKGRTKRAEKREDKLASWKAEFNESIAGVTSTHKVAAIRQAIAKRAKAAGVIRSDLSARQIGRIFKRAK
jgi:hypothetical protein